MPCYRPLSAWRTPGVNNGITFGRGKYFDHSMPIMLPCGQCIGCRLERSRRWAVRLMHESQFHACSSFLTLTYDDDHLPSDGSLRVEDFQLFMKRLRRGSGTPLRFFHCGEYGETTGRPHYHCVLFGEDFSGDRVFYKTTRAGHRLYTSKVLNERWDQGRAWIGDLSFESAAYVARYCLKKVTGERAGEHYGGRKAEYVTMSRRPGIGAGFFGRYSEEIYRSDSVVLRGREMLPPPFYDKLLEKIDPALMGRVKRERKRAGISEVSDDYGRNGPTYEEWLEHFGVRLDVKEKCKQETVSKTLKRDL